ncbi:MAG: helix-hairpin-helix domain-containing protein [Acidimicrobiales bacterium]
MLAAAVGLLAAAALGWWLLRPAAPPVESTLPLATASDSGPAADAGAVEAVTSTASPSSTVPLLVVQAAGAVRSPGLYRLDPGARVDDLIRAAGGLTERADRDRINLAAPLADGQRVWLPQRGQDEVPDVVTDAGSGVAGAGGGSGGAPSSGAGASASGPIDLNGADEAALDALPGVGPATAQAILTYRSESGPFRSIDDLLEVPGIGEAKLAQIRPLVTVG